MTTTVETGWCIWGEVEMRRDAMIGICRILPKAFALTSEQ